MSQEPMYDAIIIGAGPAGITCAYRLAKAGKEVLVIERGDTPGSKNVTGGRLYTYALEMVEAGLTKQAALERKVTHEQTMIMDGERALSVDFHDPSFNAAEKPPLSYTILRAKFDEWFAGQAEAMGATIVCGIRVDSLIESDGKIVGVVAGDDEMYSRIVVAADGANSLIAQKAGLSEEIKPSAVAVGVKEVIELAPATIEERFHLQKDEGAARMILGCTEGIQGGGFLYTNHESISLGCVFFPDQVVKHGKSVHDIFQEIKMHPSIHPLLAGGKTVEYSAHLIREAGYHGLLKKTFREGLLVIGEAAGFSINHGYTARGIDLAMLSGIAAAKAILSGGETSAVGPAYLQELEAVGLTSAMKAVERLDDLLEIPRLYKTYPKLMTDLLAHLYNIDEPVPASVIKQAMKTFKDNNLSVMQFIKDVFKGYRSL